MYVQVKESVNIYNHLIIEKNRLEIMVFKDFSKERLMSRECESNE